MDVKFFTTSTSFIGAQPAIPRRVRFSPMPQIASWLIAVPVADLSFSAMALLFPIDLSAADKLEVLRRLDRFRKWSSLDEQRYCLVCSRIITGREIYVVGGTRGTGPLRLVCPTRGCHSIAMDWVVPRDEVLAKMSMLQSESPPALNSGKPQAEKFAARLRRFATRFHRAA
jgi:hypothetical protein